MSIKNRRRRRRRRRRSTEQYELYAVHREMILLNISTSILYVRRRRRRLRKEKSLVKSLEGCICISCSQRDNPPQEEKREETTFSTLYTAAREREREKGSLSSLPYRPPVAYYTRTKSLPAAIFYLLLPMVSASHLFFFSSSKTLDM